LDTDNSRRLASNAALSATGLYAFLEFAQLIGAIEQDNADILMLEHWGILCEILKKTLAEVDEIKPANVFISVLKELIQARRVRILEHYSENHNDRSIPVIGYYKGNKEFVCLLPTITMAIVRDVFRRSEDESLNFSTAAIGKQLVEEGYMVKSGTLRIPGAGRKASPVRVWKINASKIIDSGSDIYGV